MSDESDKDLLIRQLELLNIHIMEWQHESGTSLTRLWAMSGALYRKKAENFNDFLEWKLHRFYKINTTARGRILARRMRWKGQWDFGESVL